MTERITERPRGYPLVPCPVRGCYDGLRTDGSMCQVCYGTGKLTPEGAEAYVRRRSEA